MTLPTEEQVERAARTLFVWDSSESTAQREWDTGTVKGFMGPEYRSKARAALTAALPEGWRPIETAPKDGTWFWGSVENNALSMCWHEGFGQFVTGWRVMTMAPGYTINGKASEEHSPEVQRPKGWMPAIPAPHADRAEG